MKKVLLSSAVALSLFAAAAPVFAEGTASLWVNDIDNNEVPQGSTDSESNKVMDELQAYRDAQSALDQQVAEAKKAPVGKSAVMEDQAGNKVLVIGEGESANADQPSVAPSTTDPSTPAYSAAPYSTASSSVPTFPAPSQSSAASSSAAGKKKAKKSENKLKYCSPNKRGLLSLIEAEYTSLCCSKFEKEEGIAFIQEELQEKKGETEE